MARARPERTAISQAGDPPSCSQILRALREARGVTRDGWAAALGYGRTTVQRWETGETVPDATAEAAIVALCHEHGLWRLLNRGPLVAYALDQESFSALLAAARLGGGRRWGAAGRPTVARPSDRGAESRPRIAPGPQSSNLPEPVTSFVGREQERAEVARLLRATRLLTLAGTGGCGKTRLALETARSIAGDYAAGAWLVELASVTDPALIASAVAGSLSVREEPGRAIRETLIDYLRPKRLLLVLDNCEHHVPVCARLVHDLLSSCPDLTVLATSRAVLGIAGETVWRVPSLSMPTVESDEPGVVSDPSSVSAAADIERFDAVRLFVERARAIRPAFVVTPANARAVAQVCRRLDGIPLAIELAAARLNLLTVEQIADRLDDRFRLLNAGNRTTLPRHQTLQALIDWSYDLLGEPERRLFERLSVFAGSFSLDAVEAVCGDGSYVLDVLARLVDQSLVSVEEHGSEARYRLLETLRVYARGRLAARGETEALRQRHRDHFLALAEEAEGRLYGHGQIVWFRRLADEHDNLRAALDWSERDPDGAEPELRLAGSLWQFWLVRGYLGEARRRLEEALRRPDAVSPEVAAKAHYAAGILARGQQDHPAARRHQERSLDLARAAGNRSIVAAALHSMGGMEADAGNDADARALLDECLAIRTELGDQWGIGNSLFSLGYLAHRRGDNVWAEDFYEQSLRVQRAVEDKLGLAMTLNNLGHLAEERREYARARALFEECLFIRREFGDERGIALALHGLGEMASRQGDHATALPMFIESVLIAIKLGLPKVIAPCLEGLAAVSSAVERPRHAVCLLAAADSIRKASGVPHLPAERETYGQVIAAIRSDLGTAAFEESWAQGRAMTLEQVIALVQPNAGIR
ncbi:MAG: tetratricopeptide repeat protein [Dehalococcoidia bacterium]